MQVPKVALSLALPLGAALIALPYFGSGYLIQLSIVILTFVALAESWGFFSGYTGYLSLGVAAFFGAGEEIYAYFSPVLPFGAVILFAGAVAAGLALVLGPAILRVRGTYFVILTFVLAAIVQSVVTVYESTVYATVGKIAPVEGPRTVYYLLLLIAVITVFLSYRIKNSKIGRGLFAIRNDEEVAEASGVNTVFMKVSFFALSSFFAGAVGATSVAVQGYVNPSSAFTPLVSFEVLIMSILGGSRTVSGPLVGAFILSLLSQLLLAAYPLLDDLILGIVLIAVVLLLPNGIMGTYRIGKEKSRVS